MLSLNSSSGELDNYNNSSVSEKYPRLPFLEFARKHFLTNRRGIICLTPSPLDSIISWKMVIYIF